MSHTRELMERSTGVQARLTGLEDQNLKRSEEVGFEPTDVLSPTVFGTVAFSRTQPLFLVEHRVRIELTMSCSAGSRFAN